MSKIKSEYSDLDKYKNINEDVYYYKKDTDIFHNPYGPAFVANNGYKEYWVEDNLHRLDGPAIIYSNGGGEYYINNKELTKKEFEIHPERLKYLNKEYLICLT